MARPHEEHRSKAPKTLKFTLYTISTSRYNAKISGKEYSDETMDVAVKLIREKKHEIIERDIIDDDKEMIKQTLLRAVQRDVDVIVLMGGTGLSSRDVTVEAVRPLLDKEVEGFGEIFRFESYREIGAAAALTRATAGIISRRVVLCLPGSPKAVELALKIFLDELPHLVYLARQ
ncbi:MAG: molybdopterin-binding protein [Aigarchaeota archaeon]|nr:molybdopterin-binding protein [Aigarchaeota archaeon]MCX8192926.1 molybdopterin-binding protein [Nitrososphaeria archaeon]MDW7986429.1 molybdopterin-binding protein [Nitrososphaerota archaeon]